MNKNEEQNSVIIERANAAILARDYEQASRIYKGLLKTEPENINYLNALGDLYIKNGDDKIALEYIKEIVRLQPQNLDALNSLGGIYRRLKLYDESISVLERAVMIDNTNSQVFYNLGFTYKIMGNYDEAIQCFNTVVEENPRDVLAFNHIGTIYASQKKWTEAISSYLRGLKVDPNHPILHLNIAKCYDKLGDFFKAQAEYEAVLKSKPGWIEAIECYSDLLIKKNKTKNASEIVKKALIINPKNVDMHAKLGDVYCRQDDYENAEDEYNAALVISPDFSKAMSGLANTYELTGRIEEALDMAEKMEILQPEDVSVKRQYAHILLSADKIEKAKEKIQFLYEKDSEDVHTLNLLGQYYICAGDEKKASGCFKKIRAIRHGYTSFYKEAGRRYSQKGEYKKAEEFFQKYIEQNSDDTAGYKYLAKNYEDQGMLTQALSNYKTMELFDSSNIASRQGVERVNNQILLERDKAQRMNSSTDEEFLDSDDDISLGEKIEEKENETSIIEDINNTEADQQEERVLEEENKDYDYESGFETLQEDEISSEEIFEKGRLDEELEADNQDQYSKSLDDLIGEVDLDEEGSGLEEDDTDVDEFFSNNPFGSSGKPTAPEESKLENDFIMEEDLQKDTPSDDIISFDEDFMEDEDFEKPIKPKPQKRKPQKRPQKKSPLPIEDEQEQEDIFDKDDEVLDIKNDDIIEPKNEDLFEDEKIDSDDFEEEKINDEILEEVESIPEPSLVEDDIIEADDEENEFISEELPEEENILEEQEDELEKIDDEVLDSLDDLDEDNVDMEILTQAADAIQNVADAITENKVISKTNVTAELFEKLRSLSTYLPEEKRQVFLESKIRLQLDYIISKLSGKCGLLGTATILRHQIGKEDTAAELDSGKTLLLKVLANLKVLVRSLPDITMVTSLNGQIENILSRL